MKQIHVWRNHIRIAHLDLVIVRSSSQTLEGQLIALTRLGLDTGPSNVEFHDDIPAV